MKLHKAQFARLPHVRGSQGRWTWGCNGGGGGVKNASQYLTDTLMLNQSGEGDRFSTSITVCTPQSFKPSAGTERGEVQLQQD